MSYFIKLQSPSGKQTYFVNIDEVLYMQPSAEDPNHTMLQFPGDKSLTVDMTASDIADRVK